MNEALNPSGRLPQGHPARAPGPDRIPIGSRPDPGSPPPAIRALGTRPAPLGPQHPGPTSTSPRSRAQKPLRCGRRPPPSAGEGPAAGRPPRRHRGSGGCARRGPAGPAAWRPLSVGPREGLRGWHPGWGRRARAGTAAAAAQAGRARGPGGAARARAAAGGELTSPGTAPSTPSRYSGRVRAAAGRCWRRG